MGLNQERVIAPEFRAVFNGTGGTIAKGTILKLDTSGVAGKVVKAAAATDQFYGVAARDIPNNEYGDAQIRGVALVLAGTGGMTQGAQVTTEAAGLAIVASAGNTLLGMALTAALVTELFECELGGGGEAN